MFVLHVLAEVGYSGGEFQLEQLIRHLQIEGHRNHVVVPPDARFIEICERLDVPVDELPIRRPWQTLAVPKLRRLIRRLRPDVVHFGCGRSTLWGGLAALGADGAVKVCTRRIDYPIARTPVGAGRYRHLVDHVVANCGAVRRRLLEAGVSAERISLIYEGIDSSKFDGVEEDRAASRRTLGIADNAVVLSCAATLRPRKGQRILIEAFSRLVDEFPNAVLVLAGEGDDRRCLLKQVTSLGLQRRILLPGTVHPARSLHAASDIAVMASFAEGLSNACLEAGAAGLPLIVSSVGGLPEIVRDGETGFVVEPGDVDAFTDRIRTLLSDVELRRRLGAAGRRRVEQKFQVDRMADEMEHLFLRLIDEKLRSLSSPDRSSAGEVAEGRSEVRSEAAENTVDESRATITSRASSTD
ncbi:MAG: glycosyltransferase [Planctomycetota bacterium]